MTAALAWLGVILLAWIAGCAVIWTLHLRAERRRKIAAARRRARDETAAHATRRIADLVDMEYQKLCEKEDGRG